MSRPRQSSALRELKKRKCLLAQSDSFWICWWCGNRPLDNLWDCDHSFPLLGLNGPMTATCKGCNRRRQQQIPNATQMQRLFWSERVLRSCDALELRSIAQAGSIRLFGSTEYIATLIAAVDGGKNVYRQNRGWREKKDKASAEVLEQLYSS